MNQLSFFPETKEIASYTHHFIPIGSNEKHRCKFVKGDSGRTWVLFDHNSNLLSRLKDSYAGKFEKIEKESVV